MLTDPAQSSGGLMLRCRVWFPGKGLGGAALPAPWVHAASVMAPEKQMQDAVTDFSLFKKKM